MVSAISNVVMEFLGMFAFLAFLALSVVALVPILATIYYWTAELYKWIKSKFD